MRFGALAKLRLAAAFLPIALVAGASAPAQAQQAEAQGQTVPNLQGFWNLEFNETPDPALVSKLPAGTVLIRDTGVVEFDINDYGGLTLTPKAQEFARNWKREDDLTLDRVCLPPSIIYAIQGPFPFEIYQTKDLIAFKYEYYDAIRLIFMDGRPHPDAKANHTKMGFSTGRWEGDELVVETSHIAASTITNNGLDHGDGIRMVERYRLDDNGTRLKSTQWFSDRSVINEDGARYIEWGKQEGNIVPYECDPTFALEYAQIPDQ